MAKVKLQSKWKKFIAIVLAVLTSAAAVFGIVKLGVTLSSDTKEISPSFKRGALDVSGKYVITNDSIVTKELFECQGLKITPDFDSTVSYQVFYYDQDQTYLECSEVQENAFSYTPVLAKYASVVITPDVDNDGEPVEVKWHQVRKYAKQITIEVNREQKFIDVRTIDRFAKGEHTLYASITRKTGTDDLVVTSSEKNGYVRIDVSNMSKIKFVFPGSGSLAIQNYFVDENGSLVGENVNLFDGDKERTFTVPENAKYLYANYLIGLEYSIFQVI